MFAIGVLIVGDVGYGVEGVATVDTLSLGVSDLHTIFGNGDDTLVLFTGYPWQPTLALYGQERTISKGQ